LLSQLILAALLQASQASAPPPNLIVWNTARVSTGERWDWSVFVLADNAVLSRIKCVSYVLHPTFTPQTRTICDPGSKAQPFALETNGWGTFELGVNVFFRDTTRPLEMRYPLRFSGIIYASGEMPSKENNVTIRAQSATAQDGRFEFLFSRTGNPAKLILQEIRVFEDGSAGSTRWVFDVLVNGRNAFRLGERKFDDSRKPGIVRPGLPAYVVPANSGNLTITLLGRRP